MKRAQAISKDKRSKFIFILEAWSEKRTRVSGELGIGIRPDYVNDNTSIQVTVSRTLEPAFRDLVTINVRRKSARKAEQWGDEHDENIVLLTDEVDVLLATLSEAVAQARRDDILPSPTDIVALAVATGPRLA